MNKDVRLGTNYPDHPKIRKLEKRLGAEGIRSHVFLLCYVARITPSGTLKDMDSEDIEIAARWKGQPGQFVDTLVDLRLLDRNGETFSVHNWPHHNFYCVTTAARSRSARRSAIIGWLVRRNLIPRKSKVPPEINLDQEPEEIAKEILEFNAKRNTKRNAPSPPPPPRGEGEGVGGTTTKVVDIPPPPIVITTQLVEMAEQTYNDTTLKKGWLLRFGLLPKEKQDEVKELADLKGVKLPEPVS